MEGVTYEAHKPEDALLAEAATMGMIAYHAGIISEAMREARSAAFEEAAKIAEGSLGTMVQDAIEQSGHLPLGMFKEALASAIASAIREHAKDMK